MKNEQVISYMVHRPDFIEKGEYRCTAVDDQKDAADMLIEAIDGSYYTINPKGKTIEGKRGVKRYSNGFYAVTESVLRRLETRYTFATNF